MTGELPAGLGQSDVRTHAVNLSVVGSLINLTGKFLTAEDGSPEEAAAETELEEFIERVVDLGPDTAGGALLVFASLITQVGDETTVQQWFDDQSKHIAAALQQEESGD